MIIIIMRTTNNDGKNNNYADVHDEIITIVTTYNGNKPMSNIF